MFDYLPIAASVISLFSRAGLNVVDRHQFRQEKACPLAIGCWNNLLPVLIFFPIVLSTPASKFCFNDLLSLEVTSLALIIQFVALSFSFAFKKLRVTDIAILSKSADITIPLVLVIAGTYSVSFSYFLLLPIIILMFVYSAGIEAFKKSYQSSTILVLVLTIQGLYAYFVNFDMSLERGFWGLLSISFSILVWRFIFSSLFVISRQRGSYFYAFPRPILSRFSFYLRGVLTVVTQFSFVYAITSEHLMIVLPILNATGFLGALFAHIFLGEKLSLKDFLCVFFAFLITGLAIIFLNHENF